MSGDEKLRHAYLIIAHSNWKQLKLFLELLDEPNNSIFIHIDAKVKNAPILELENVTQNATTKVFQEYKVYWGSFELVQTELFLFKKAHVDHYDYYHLLSGADLPIKSQHEINRFFEENKGYEFVHYDTDERLKTDKEITRRTKYYHFLQNYRRRYKYSIFNNFFTFLERVLLVCQIAFKVDRMKKHSDIVIRYGSQWVSITDNLVQYILQNEKLIEDIFCFTNCADELFIQTLVYNSEFKDKLYDKKYDDSVIANMRLIDMKKRGKNGNPYTWRISDFEEIKQSECLFARKFDIGCDDQIVKKICQFVKQS